jgi:hypothetical protein
MHLSDDDLRDVLERAEQIQFASRSRNELSAEVEGLIEAAAAVGLTRSAVERALRERLDLSMTPPAVGEMIFAQSADQKYYVAEVLSSSPESVDVRFLRGGQHTVTLDQIRPCSFLPGQRVTVNWPWWGPWTCTVVSYDAKGQWVNLSDGWGETRIFPVAEVWQNPKRSLPNMGSARARIYAKLIGAGVGVGAFVGSAVTVWLMKVLGG